MNKREVYAKGVAVGREIAEEVGRGRRAYCDELLDEVLATESEHYRQFSPFEFFADSLNRSRNPDAMWEAYERGVYAGAYKQLRKSGCRK